MESLHKLDPAVLSARVLEHSLGDRAVWGTGDREERRLHRLPPPPSSRRVSPRQMPIDSENTRNPEIKREQALARGRCPLLGKRREK